MAKTDTNIFTFLHALTKSVRQSRRKLFHGSSSDSRDYEVKTIRLMFALSVLQLCTNNTCNAPFQIAVTESVICHGGQQTLVKILNRLGAAVSSKRLATLKEKKREHQKRLNSKQVHCSNHRQCGSFAYVSGLDASRSWHGTSTQLIQPLTVSGDLSKEDVCTQNEPSHIPRSYCQATSPINSPMPKNKSKCQRRTLTEQPSPHTTISLPPPKVKVNVVNFQQCK